MCVTCLTKVMGLLCAVMLPLCLLVLFAPLQCDAAEVGAAPRVSSATMDSFVLGDDDVTISFNVTVTGSPLPDCVWSVEIGEGRFKKLESSSMFTCNAINNDTKEAFKTFRMVFYSPTKSDIGVYAVKFRNEIGHAQFKFELKGVMAWRRYVIMGAAGVGGIVVLAVVINLVLCCRRRRCCCCRGKRRRRRRNSSEDRMSLKELAMRPSSPTTDTATDTATDPPLDQPPTPPQPCHRGNTLRGPRPPPKPQVHHPLFAPSPSSPTRQASEVSYAALPLESSATVVTPSTMHHGYVTMDGGDVSGDVSGDVVLYAGRAELAAAITSTLQRFRNKPAASSYERALMNTRRISRSVPSLVAACVSSGRHGHQGALLPPGFSRHNVMAGQPAYPQHQFFDSMEGDSGVGVAYPHDAEDCLSQLASVSMVGGAGVRIRRRSWNDDSQMNAFWRPSLELRSAELSSDSSGGYVDAVSPVDHGGHHGDVKYADDDYHREEGFLSGLRKCARLSENKYVTMTSCCPGGRRDLPPPPAPLLDLLPLPPAPLHDPLPPPPAPQRDLPPPPPSARGVSDHIYVNVPVSWSVMKPGRGW